MSHLRCCVAVPLPVEGRRRSEEIFEAGWVVQQGFSCLGPVADTGAVLCVHVIDVCLLVAVIGMRVLVPLFLVRARAAGFLQSLKDKVPVPVSCNLSRIKFPIRFLATFRR